MEAEFQRTRSGGKGNEFHTHTSKGVTEITTDGFDELMENLSLTILMLLNNLPANRRLFQLKSCAALLIIAYDVDLDQGEAFVIGKSITECLHIKGGDVITWKSNTYLFQDIDVNGIQMSCSYINGQGSTTTYPLSMIIDIQSVNNL